jgi:hypothetical protein
MLSSTTAEPKGSVPMVLPVRQQFYVSKLQTKTTPWRLKPNDLDAWRQPIPAMAFAALTSFFNGLSIVQREL